MPRQWVVVLWGACVPPSDELTETTASEVVATDMGRASGYQDFWFGTFKRGRGNVVADFDGDGDFDVFSGNPGNQSFLLRNESPRGGPLRFEPWQILSEDELFYGGVAADFDNDGDQDLFVSAGANDGNAQDRYFRNDGGASPLVDATKEHPLAVPNGTMGMRAFDADRDGDLDLWASNYARANQLTRPIDVAGPVGQNQLYLSRDGTFVDRAINLGLGHRKGSRHSSILDFDLDGDLDIYENNFIGGGVLWRNRLVEDGELFYEDVTEAFSIGDALLSGPTVNQAMCSLVGDLDNDGWDDLILLHRGRDEQVAGALQGHQVFMNVEGTGFVEVGRLTGLAAEFEDREELPSTDTKLPMSTGWGVMGCQIGDIDLDGFPDVFIGRGSGGIGGVNQLFVSSGRRRADVPGVGVITVPVFEPWTDLLDQPPELPDGAPDVSYPLRTHGTSFADFDSDGISEIAVHNGGPAILPYEEPNRLWAFELPDPRFLRIRLVGDGRDVNRDAIGARVRVRVQRRADEAEWELYKTRRAGSGFGAQNAPELVFGLADGDRVAEVEVTWPDGEVQSVEPPRSVSEWMIIRRR